MADFVFNIAKGRAHELVNNVETGAPANSRLLVVPFNSTATDATLRDLDTLQAVIDDVNTTERTAGGWNRKTLGAAAITITVDDTNDRVDLDIDDQVWTSVATSNDSTDLLIAYIPDGVTPGADSTAIPLTWHDFAVTTDGSDVTAVINAAGFFRAS